MYIINSYDKFLKCCKELSIQLGSYKIIIDNDSITSIKLDVVKGGNAALSPTPDRDFTYFFENDYIKNFIYSLFEVENSYKETYLFVDDENHKNFIAPYYVLDLLLLAEVLKSKNIDLVRKFQIKSKNGKIRDIIAPSKFLKPGLRDINKILQKTYDNRNSSFQVAYKRGKCIVDNALPHINNDYCFKIDLHHFFPSCKRDNVEKYVKFLFKDSINEKFLMDKFLDIILDNDSLYIGNPVSGTIANAIISAPVKYLYNMCKKCGISFSVYADDITFGSNRYLDKNFIINMFNKVFIDQFKMTNFTLSVDKCYGVSKCKRKITGVTINHENKITVDRKIYKTIRQTLHQLQYDDTSHYDYNKLKGQIAFMNMVDHSGKLDNLISKYEKVMKKYNLASYTILSRKHCTKSTSDR